ncbi:MAG: SlyX family protein [Gammaproteobacteria bacterium]|nr:SlyX family protein [Gammaproteobacteria bacterium]
MEKRIAELESRIAFQDNTIEELNAVVTQQQRQIDQMEKSLSVLKDHLKNLVSSNIASEDEETPPPHY